MIPTKGALIALTATFIMCGYSVSSADQARPAKASKRECFLGRQVSGFSALTDSLVDIQVGADRYYRLSLEGSCPDAAFRNKIALRTLTGGTWICQGLDAEIIVPDAMGGQRCLIRDIQPITKDQWRADSHPHR